MSKLRMSQLGDAQAFLAEALRTTDSTPEKILDRFEEIRPGVERELLAKTNHLLTGRRGVGKSTLLLRARVSLRSEQIPVVMIDMESFKYRDYPDVLIEIVLTVLRDLTAFVRPRGHFRRWKLFRSLRPLFIQLNQILDDPNTVESSVARERTSSKEQVVSSGLTVKPDVLRLSAKGTLRRTNLHRSAESGTADLSKAQRLNRLVPQLKIALTKLVETAGQDYGLVFLDDFYHVGSADQPVVLDFLHRTTKGTGLYLKVGGLGARLQPFRDGDPPMGMQIGHDISRLPLDVTLTDFNTAKRFLEAMLEGVLRPLEVSVPELFTSDCRDRLVLASGGAVARDYITLIKGALEKSVERLSQEAELDANSVLRVTTADVQKTMSALTQLREEDSFALDAVSDADALRTRWRDISAFAKESKTVFILIPQAELDDREFGREISQIEQLRLLHRIRETSANSGKWKGVPMVAFMTDLGSAAQQRLRIEIPAFWKSTSESDKLRRASWVYLPNGSSQQPPSSPTA